MLFDAVIIGAGPSGASAAVALAKQGRSVAIVERSTFPLRKVCGEFVSAASMPVLDSLGAGDRFRDLAGPEVSRIALFATGPGTEAAMLRGHGQAFGRALGRDVLDGVLLDAARVAGASVYQPWKAVEIVREGGLSSVRIECDDRTEELVAPVLIAAHGSWETGKLQTTLARRHHSGDFLGFKAHFTGASLSRAVMPLLVFPGGYGGMVWSDGNRLSLSCCIRRDALNEVRRVYPSIPAGAATYRHILAFCPAAAAVLADASLMGDWLAAGPIRPGARRCYQDDVYRVGNLAGECHPIIAEGISMALQSGWLLARELGRSEDWGPAARAIIAERYSRGWRRQFTTRLRLAAVLSRIAIFPRTASVMDALVRSFPPILSIGASWSGKTRALGGLS